MQTKIDKFEQNFINPLEGQKREEKPTENYLKKSNEIESDENSKNIDQIESSQSCPFISNGRKTSYDSLSICASQADTLSQTSESSFFLSYSTPNTQQIPTNEIIIDKKTDEETSFYSGVEEYFKNLMPEKFTEYTHTKNYINKNSYLKSWNKRDNGLKIKKDNTIIQENIQMQNYFYFPVIYYPINDFYFNQLPFTLTHQTKKTTKKVKNDKLFKKDKKQNEDEVKNKTQKVQHKENKEHKYEKKDEKKDEIEIEKISISNKEDGKNNNSFFNKNNNYKRNKDSNYKKTSYYNKKYNQNYQRQYSNKYSNYYYNDNDIYEEEKTYHYNNNYHKKRYQRPFENKFYGYK